MAAPGEMAYCQGSLWYLWPGRFEQGQPITELATKQSRRPAYMPLVCGVPLAA